MMQDSKIDELEKQVKYLEKELNESYKAWDLDLKNHQRRETALVNTLAEKNEEIEKLKELNEYLRNQLRMKTDMLKATELKIEEFDHVLTKYRAKIKELEGHDEKSQLAILAGAYAIRKHFDGGAYYSITTNGLISWKRAEQILMDMVTKE